MSHLDPAKGKTATQGVGLAAKACARCIAVRIQVHGLGWRVPRTAHKHQTALRRPYQLSMPTWPPQLPEAAR